MSDERTRTPLQFALACHHKDTAELLISLGACVKPVEIKNDNTKKTPSTTPKKTKETKKEDNNNNNGLTEAIDILMGEESEEEEDEEEDDDDYLNDDYDYAKEDEFLSEYEYHNEWNQVGEVDGNIDPFVFAVSRGYLDLAQVYNYYLNLFI